MNETADENEGPENPKDDHVQRLEWLAKRLLRIARELTDLTVIEDVAAEQLEEAADDLEGIAEEWRRREERDG